MRKMQLLIPREQLPFRENTFVHTSDVKEAQNVVNSSVTVEDRKYSLLKKNGKVEITLSREPLNNLSIYGCRFRNGSINIQGGPITSFQVMIPLQGFIYNRVTCTKTSPGELTFLTPGSEIDIDWHDVGNSLVFLISPTRLESHLGHRVQNGPLSAEEAGRIQKVFRSSDKNISGLFNIINTIYIDSVSGKAMLNNWRCRQALEDILLESFSVLMENPRPGQMQSQTPGKLRLAINYIEDNKHRAITVKELENLTGYCRRTLENYFNHGLGVGPKKYVTQTRLETIREILEKNVDPGKTVTDIAADWGYYNLSYFTKLYREQFGETPARTLRRKKL
jgi:AraC-like DNA-binding protein